MKTIAFYLPQFHQTSENDEWWGEGFTEWTNMRKAEPLFDGHYQPRIPLNNNYYDLSDINVMKWQTDIAREHGIYGFCFYHYWFDGKKLLHKPIEQYLENKDIDFPFCICWANENWTQAWVGRSNKILIKQEYGGRELWREHYNYLKDFLLDDRYIKVNGNPLLVIYRPEIIPDLNDMLDFWNECAQKDGIKKIEYAYQHVDFRLVKDKDDSRFTYNVEYQPMYARKMNVSKSYALLRDIKNKVFQLFKQDNTSDFRGYVANQVQIFDYDKTWDYILSMKPVDEKCVPCAFVDWDNTPRKGEAGAVCSGVNPEKFGKYFKQLVKKNRDEYKKDIMFIFAWNEWAEGGYLEPDEKYGFGYLNAIKTALLELNEFPY